MKRSALVALVALTLAAGTAPAMGHHYGSCGFQFGFYHYPPPGAAPSAGYSYSYASPGYSYAPTAGYSYASPGYSYASPGYSYAPTAGYAPAMAPSGGCSGGGYAPGYGLSYGAAPGYGYPYSNPQAGVFPFPGLGFGGGSLIEAIRGIKEIAKEFEGGRSDSATREEIQKLRDEVKSLRSDMTNISKDDIQKLRDEVARVRRDFDTAKFPADLDKRLGDLKKEQQETNLQLQKVDKFLKDKFPNEYPK
jgi:hypothetical protein